MEMTRAAVIRNNLRKVQDKIAEFSLHRTPRLVVVSKTWPVEDIKAAYDAGQRNFGENYINELLEKQPQLPNDIQWHFIGALQSNKLKILAGIPNMTLETLDEKEKAVKLNKLVIGWKMPVFVQVNTSGEAQKHGVTPSAVPELVQFITTQCPNLSFSGLMTIGSASSSSQDVNPDFERLVNCQRNVARELAILDDSIELSMGMSQDYVQAIKQGATSVRVGSAIFGDRI
jgi:pyridoxal phosphate enzyme (YggS family)